MGNLLYFLDRFFFHRSLLALSPENPYQNSYDYYFTKATKDTPDVSQSKSPYIMYMAENKNYIEK